jgi:GNAT superfamily N-acetyltransferase
MPHWPLVLRRASVNDMGVVIRLIEEAAGWLRTKGTDQWSKPWPNLAGRDSRILASLSEGKTFIGWQGRTPAATITADPDHDPYWPDDMRRDPAVYVHRLIVSRPFKGAGLGAALLDWAGRNARSDYGAMWIRVSAWTTNSALHAYYRRQGFVLVGLNPDDGYPSAARFQRPTALFHSPGHPGLFRESWQPDGHG